MPPDTLSCSPAATWTLLLFGLVVGLLVGWALEPVWRGLRVRRYLNGLDPNLKSFHRSYRKRADRSEATTGWTP